MMMVLDWSKDVLVFQVVSGMFFIFGVFDVFFIFGIYVNDELKLDEEFVVRFSF